jgi:hypothetical protein
MIGCQTTLTGQAEHQYPSFEYWMHNIHEITNDVMHDIGSDITPDII